MSDKYVPLDRVPLPPANAKVHTTACDYCIVGCGYKAYTWPIGEEGGPAPDENAFGSSFPGSPLTPWVSPNQHNIVNVDGEPHNVVIVPDFEAQVVNKGVDNNGGT